MLPQKGHAQLGTRAAAYQSNKITKSARNEVGMMDELKPCPLDEARKILWYCAQFTDNTHWKNQYRRALTAICDELDRRPAPENQPLDAVELAKIAMALQQLKSENAELVEMLNKNKNNPLTVDELKNMCGEAVWISMLNIAKHVSCEIITEIHDNRICTVGANGKDYASFSLYAKTWLAYARKPEGNEK